MPVLVDQLHQTTIRRPVSLKGAGLHSGAPVTMTIKPAGPDEGITFVRSDLPGRPAIKATPDNVVRTVKCTTIGVSTDAEVQTTEHLMAAVAGMGLDNALIELTGPEVPTGDGSAALFADLLERGGLEILPAERKYITLAQPLHVGHGDMVLVALPATELKLTYVFTNPHPQIGNLFAEFVIAPETFRREIAPARTLAFTREIEAMRSQGLAMGGDLDAVVVIDESGYVNERRFPDEVVRHKVLDLLGDLALLGPLKAHVIGVRSGHAANAALSKAILETARVATSG